MLESLETLRQHLAQPKPWYRHAYYAMYRTFQKVQMFPRHVYWFIQRGRRGYADCDVWDFGDYLSKVISGGLRQLAENDIGHPADFQGGREGWNAKLNEWADATGAETRLDFLYDEHPDRVDKIIQKSIDTEKRRTAALQELAPWFGHLWD